MEPVIKLTYEDYVRTPDGERYQLLDGVLVKEPAPGVPHQVVSANLSFLLQTFVRATGVGLVLTSPIDLVLSRENVLQPDIAFIARERVAGVVNDRGIWAAPDLVVEILSPSTEKRDRELKREIYARHGLTELWLVDLKHQVIEVYRSTEGTLVLAQRHGPGDMVTTPTLPGLTIPVDEVFRPAPGLEWTVD